MAYWAPSAQTDMDDVFDDEAEDELVVRKEWNRAENDIRKTGYRLGLSAGEEETLQQGFDAGYKEASRVAFAVGRLQGMISSWLNLTQGVESGDADRTPPSAPNPHSSQWMKLLEDCTELLHTLPLSLQEPSRRFDSRLGTSDMDTGPRSHESRAPPQGDSVGELTALLDTCGLHDLPPMRDPVLKTKLVDLIRRYHALRSGR